MRKKLLLYGWMIGCLCFCQAPQQQDPAEKNLTKAADPLPSWSETETKQAIIDFVNKTTTRGSADFIPTEDRIACFDNDGTLWSEQPFYFQVMFALDRVKALALQHPEWKHQEPFKSLLTHDAKTAFKGGEKGLSEIIMATHAGLTTDEFNTLVRDWMATARHPVTGKRFVEMVSTHD